MPRKDSNNLSTSRYVALDRDGTVVVERHRPIGHPNEVELIPGAAEGLRKLIEMDFGLVLITNQSAIGRGTMNSNSLDSVHDHLRVLLKGQEVSLDGIYVCPHAPWDDCRCRKPKPGLLDIAAADLDVSPNSFIVIGDKASDVDCGKNAGAATILVRTGYGAQVEQEGYAGADHIADGLQEAAQVIQGLMSVRHHG